MNEVVFKNYTKLHRYISYTILQKTVAYFPCAIKCHGLIEINQKLIEINQKTKFIFNVA